MSKPDSRPKAASRRKLTKDIALGPWVYCSQHLAVHQSGWCSVSVDDKVGLGSFRGGYTDQGLAAAAKCRRLGLKLYNQTK